MLIDKNTISNYKNYEQKSLFIKTSELQLSGLGSEDEDKKMEILLGIVVPVVAFEKNLVIVVHFKSFYFPRQVSR